MEAREAGCGLSGRIAHFSLRRDLRQRRGVLHIMQRVFREKPPACRVSGRIAHFYRPPISGKASFAHYATPLQRQRGQRAEFREELRTWRRTGAAPAERSFAHYAKRLQGEFAGARHHGKDCTIGIGPGIAPIATRKRESRRPWSARAAAPLSRAGWIPKPAPASRATLLINGRIRPVEASRAQLGSKPARPARKRSPLGRGDMRQRLHPKIEAPILTTPTGKVFHFYFAIA